jgi:GNAT superfamily N-acetyltransferase
MTIRFAEKSDKENVLKLLDELGTEVNRRRGITTISTEAQEIGGEIFEEVISQKSTKIFVAEDGGTLLGLVTFYIIPNIRHGWHRGHIEDFVVSERARGKGIGSKLFDAIKVYCKENSIKVVKLDSGVELTDAHRFYEKNGGTFTEKMFRFNI